jgi:hypothetical protein
MDQGPLVKEEIEAGATLAREFDRYAPVKAAFWLKESDNPYRYLYLGALWRGLAPRDPDRLS